MAFVANPLPVPAPENAGAVARMPGARARDARHTAVRSDTKNKLSSRPIGPPVEKRELNVHEDHIGMLRGSGAQRLLAVADLEDLESSMAKEIAKDPSIVLLVLDHQNAFGHACPNCCSTSTGTSRKNVEPQPDSDSTQIRPPCIATMSRAIDRPSPVPPFGLVVELSACRNSSKILVDGGVDARSGYKPHCAQRL
jgi:hypothetical protein